MSQFESEQFVEGLQTRMRVIEYRGISTENPTVSVGIVEIEPDGIVTDREALKQAQDASVAAKDKGGDQIVAREATRTLPKVG